VRSEYRALRGIGTEELFSAPASETPQQAKSLFGAWLEEVENRIAMQRAKRRGEGHDLTQKQARALAGEWYGWFTGPYDEDPGKPDHWADLHEALWELLIHVAGDEETRTLDLECPKVRTEVHPILADEAKTAQFLGSRGEETLTPAAMTLFLNEVIREFSEATKLLKRKARGDYSPDQHLQTLPAYTRPKALMTVAKLKGARDRVRRRTGKCEGRKSYAERDPSMIALVRKIKGRGGPVSLRKVAAELEANGHVTASGKRYSASAVASMLA
jgi:hypothetical protein